MKQQAFELKIISPGKMIFEGEVTRVNFPGKYSPFTVLCNHAPLISALQKGVITWDNVVVNSVVVEGGFVRVKNNVVTACVEIKN